MYWNNLLSDNSNKKKFMCSSVVDAMLKYSEKLLENSNDFCKCGLSIFCVIIATRLVIGLYVNATKLEDFLNVYMQQAILERNI